MKLETLYAQAFRSAEKRAAKKGWEFSLHGHWRDAIIQRAGGRCEGTGIRFSGETVPSTSWRPYIPSLDRVNPQKGYTFGNTLLVCSAYNVAINRWGREVFSKIAFGFLRMESTRHGDAVKVYATAPNLKGVKKIRYGSHVRFLARISVDGKRYCLGRFFNPQDAHHAYLRARRRVDQGESIADLITNSWG